MLCGEKAIKQIYDSCAQRDQRGCRLLGARTKRPSKREHSENKIRVLEIFKKYDSRCEHFDRGAERWHWRDPLRTEEMRGDGGRGGRRPGLPCAKQEDKEAQGSFSLNNWSFLMSERGKESHQTHQTHP